MAIKSLIDTPEPAPERLHLSGTLTGGPFTNVPITCESDDPIVVAELVTSEDPSSALAQIIGLGASAAHMARNGYVIRDVQKDLNQMLEGTKAAVGNLHNEIAAAGGEGGSYGQTLKNASEALVARLDAALVSHADPSKPGTLASTLHVVGKREAEIAAEERVKTLRDVRQIVADQRQQIDAAVRSMRNLEPGSALAVALEQIRTSLNGLTALVTASQAVTNVHLRQQEGRTFEDHVAETVGEISRRACDSPEHSGNHLGEHQGRVGRRRRGDITCTVKRTDDRKIVLEVMDREKRKLTLGSAIAELAEARQNRGADAAIAVVPDSDNALMCHQPFCDLDDGLWAVVLPKQISGGGDTLALELVYHMARQHVMTIAKEVSGPSVHRMAKILNQAKQKLALCEDIRRQLGNAAQANENVGGILDQLEREIRDCIQHLLALLEGRQGEGEENSLPPAV
jgi:hypothetical protein